MQVLEFPKCVNFDCKRHITRFEVDRLSRIDEKRRYHSNYNLCIKCRRLKWKNKEVSRVQCMECGCMIYIQTQLKKFCSQCRLKHQKDNCKAQYVRRAKLRPVRVLKRDVLMKLLEDGLNKKDWAKTGLTKSSFRSYITKLRREGINVKLVRIYTIAKN